MATQEVVIRESTAPSLAQAFMPVMSIEDAVARRNLIVQATQQLMKPDVDFGKLPGTERDVLLQPGADKLCNLFGLVIQYEVVEVNKDWSGGEHGGEPFFYYEVRGRAYRGDMLMGEGIGSCNSWESKYRWRKAERVCPNCGAENIRKSKRPGDGWYCWAKTGGCGATFAETDQAITNQETGRKPNPDIFDIVNTIQKMAYKRAKISTTINATSASEFFTQDMEDFAQPPSEPEAEKPAGRPAAPAPPSERKPPLRPEPTVRMTFEQALGSMRDFKSAVDMLSRMKQHFCAVLPEAEYSETLARFGMPAATAVRNLNDARACFRALWIRLEQVKAEGVAA